MHTFLYVIIIIAMLATLFALVRGVIGMLRGTDPMRSNKLMQLRTALQFGAVMLMVLYMTLYRH